MHSEVANIVHAFESWDESGSGIISREHLTVLIRALTPGVTDVDIDTLFEALETEGVRLENIKYMDFVEWLWSDAAKESAKVAPQSHAVMSEEPRQEADGDKETRRRGLWEAELSTAASRASHKYSETKVRQYFIEVKWRLESDEYCSHIKGALFNSIDTQNRGKVAYAEVADLIEKSLGCAADISGSGRRPSAEEIRDAFDMHDTLVTSRGFLGVDEFLNLMRFLQIKVAEAAMPLSQLLSQA